MTPNNLQGLLAERTIERSDERGKREERREKGVVQGEPKGALEKGNTVLFTHGLPTVSTITSSVSACKQQ